MRNARKYNNRITIGGVPDSEDLEQLKELGYKTLIDLREEDEKFGGLVNIRANRMGFRCIEIPICRSGIKIEDMNRFYHAIYEKGSAPIYAFSVMNEVADWYGALGYTKEYPIEMGIRGVRSYSIGAEGTMNIMRIIIARELLGKEFLPYK